MLLFLPFLLLPVHGLYIPVTQPQWNLTTNASYYLNFLLFNNWLRCQGAASINVRIAHRIETNEGFISEQIGGLCESLSHMKPKCLSQTNATFSRLKMMMKLGFENLLDDLCGVTPPIVQRLAYKDDGVLKMRYSCQMVMEGVSTLNNSILKANDALQASLKRVCQESYNADCESKIEVANDLVDASNMAFIGYVTLFCGKLGGDDSGHFDFRKAIL